MTREIGGTAIRLGLDDAPGATAAFVEHDERGAEESTGDDPGVASEEGAVERRAQ